jgi:hypothetical protein
MQAWGIAPGILIVTQISAEGALQSRGLSELGLRRESHFSAVVPAGCHESWGATPG